MRAVIFANGQLDRPVRLEPDDLIIAADGGARHCLELGLRPQVVVGDFDSVKAAELETLRSQGAEIIAFPARKDYTDLELALIEARQRGADQVLLLAALGMRWDQSLANLLLPAAFPGLRISLVDGPQEITCLHPGQALEIDGQPGDTVSLIPLGGDAEGITTHGLEYPLAAETLRLGSTRGVSNILLPQASDDRASVTLQAGLLLCIVIHHAQA